MWIARRMARRAGREEFSTGRAAGAPGGRLSVRGAGEARGLRCAAPWGVESLPPEGERVLVLPGAGLCFGTVRAAGVAPGEVRLFSAGGAEILLKNSGEIVINGQSFPKPQGETAGEGGAGDGSGAGTGMD